MLGYKLWKSKTINGSVYSRECGSNINGRYSGAFMCARCCTLGETDTMLRGFAILMERMKVSCRNIMRFSTTTLTATSCFPHGTASPVKEPRRIVFQTISPAHMFYRSSPIDSTIPDNHNLNEEHNRSACE